MNSTAKTFVNTLASFQRISTAKPTHTQSVGIKLNNHSVRNAAKRVADAISILTQIKKGPFALRRFFWFRADPIA